MTVNECKVALQQIQYNKNGNKSIQHSEITIQCTITGNYNYMAQCLLE